MRKLLAKVSLSVAAVVIGLMGLSACGETEEEKSFGAIEITLSQSTVSWNAVEGATGGYTLLIGSGTVEVTVTSVDLLSDLTKAKLTEGENKVSVKVNATAEMKESAYSNEVVYVYQDEARIAAEAFAAKVSAIGDIKAEDAEAKIAEAESAYSALSQEAKQKQAAVTAKASLDEVKKAYETYVTDTAEAKAFADLVNAIGDIKATGAKEKIDAAQTAYEELSEQGKELAAADKTKLDAVKKTYETYVADTAAAKAFADQVTAIGDVKANGAEAKIKAAESAYAALSTAAKEMQSAKTAKTALEQKRAEYDAYMAETHAQAFADLVNDIGDIKADGAEAKIKAAESSYATLSTAAKATQTAKTAKATLDEKRSAYDVYMAETHAKAFEALVNAIEDIKADGAGEKIEAAETAYEGLSSAAKDVQIAKDAKALLEQKRADYDVFVADKAAAKAYADLVTAIGDIKADGAGEKIEAAETAYKALSEQAKGLATTDKEKFDTVKADYETYLVDKAEAKAFADQVNAIDVKADGAGDKIAEAKAAYEALTEQGKGLAAADKAKLDAVESSYQTYLEDKAAAQAFATLVSEIGEDEAKLMSADVAYGQLTAQGKELAQEAYAQVVAKQNAAKQAVKDLESRITATVAKQEITVANYEALIALKAEAEGLGVYSQTLVDSAKVTSIQTRIDVIVKTICAEKTVVLDTAYTAEGAKLNLYVFRKFYNVLEEEITDASLEALTVSGDSVEITQGFTKLENGLYRACITMDLTQIKNANYTVQGEEALALDYASALHGNVWFSADGENFKEALNGEGNIQLNKPVVGDEVWLGIYEEGAISLNESNQPVFNAPAIAKLNVTDVTENPFKMADFRRMLAHLENAETLFFGKDLSVQLVFYTQSVVDGKLQVSEVKADKISKPIQLSLSEADKYYALPTTAMDNGIWLNPKLEFTLISQNDLPLLYEKINEILEKEGVSERITEENGTQYLGVLVEAMQGENVLFAKQVELKAQSYGHQQLVEDWTRKHFIEEQNSDEISYDNMKYYMSYAWTESAPESLKQFFPQEIATRKELGQNDDQKAAVQRVELKKDLFIMDSSNVIEHDNDTFYKFLRGKNGAPNGEYFASNDAKYAEIRLTSEQDASKQYVVYLFVEDGDAKLYSKIADGKPAADAKTVTLTGGATNAYYEKANFGKFFEESFEGVVWADGWKIEARYIRNEESKNFLFQGEFVETSASYPKA